MSTSSVSPRAAIYARVSSDDQECQMQLTELNGFVARMGWPAVAPYVEIESGKAGVRRPVLERLLSDARMKRFDVVLAWKLDRFGRSLQDLIANIQTLDAAGVRFIAPNQGIDTDNRSPVGKLLLHMMGAFAEFERSLIVERVTAGIKQHKANWKLGRIGRDLHTRSGKDLPTGRPPTIFRRDLAREMRAAGSSWNQIAGKLNVARSAVRRACAGVSKDGF